MLFVGIQKHGPRECPATRKGAATLYNHKAKSIKVKAIYRCGPAHTLIYILEADDFAAVEDFFAPGMTRCQVKILPVVPMA